MGATDYRVDDQTTIRVRPSSFGGGYTAVEIRNGYEMGPVGDGSTADAAHQQALSVIRSRDELTEAVDELEATGDYADLTTGPKQGIHHQMQTIARSPARSGECHYCGLDEATCDCH